MPDLSIVVALYNEEGNVEPLISELEKALSGIDESSQVVLVDDGSSDGTWQKIKSVAAKDDAITAVRLSRNFGHQHALLAGIRHSTGRAIVLMDGDLQHPPDVIPRLVAEWKRGYQIVDTRRQDTEVASFFKRKSSQLYYKIFSLMTDVPMSTGTSDFRLLDRIVVDSLLEFRDVDLFLRGAVNWLGFSATTVPYKAGRRFSGESKYNLKKMLQFAKGAIISFSTKPLIIGVWIGLATSCLAFAEIIYILIQYARGETFPGWASTTSILAFLFGVLFVMLGVIGTYLARIHQSLQGRPRYVTSETINAGAGKSPRMAGHRPDETLPRSASPDSFI